MIQQDIFEELKMFIIKRLQAYPDLQGELGIIYDHLDMTNKRTPTFLCPECKEQWELSQAKY